MGLLLLIACCCDATREFVSVFVPHRLQSLFTDMFGLTLSIYLPHSYSSSDQHGTWKLLLRLLQPQYTCEEGIQHYQDPQLLSEGGIHVSLCHIVLLLLSHN